MLNSKWLLSGLVILLSCVAFLSAAGVPNAVHPPTDAAPGWKLAIQCWSFNQYTFMEAVDKTADLGLSWIEAYPGQTIEKGSDAKFEPSMSDETRQKIKLKLQQTGISLVNFGVTGLSGNEEQDRKVFDFAKDMGIRTIVTEPAFEAYDTIDKLAKEYKINVAIHNHPKPTRYWDPQIVLDQLKGRSQYLGACCDTGHWVRSGFDPVECLKKLQGRVKTIHLKELYNNTDQQHDTIWGQGLGNVPRILDELNRQKFTGTFSIEYEYNWTTSMPEIRKCVEFFDSYSAKLKPGGWKSLFKNDLSNAILKEGSWSFNDGLLTRNGDGDIWTKEQYGNFVLDCSFKVADNTNSGVFLRTGDTKNWLPWIEVQIQNDYGKAVNIHSCAGIFDILAPSVNANKPAGEWNRLTITAIDNRVLVMLNGQTTIDMDLNKWTEAHKNPDGTPNKFDVAYKDLPRIGHLCFQDHGAPVWYRNIKILSFDK